MFEFARLARRPAVGGSGDWLRRASGPVGKRQAVRVGAGQRSRLPCWWPLGVEWLLVLGTAAALGQGQGRITGVSLTSSNQVRVVIEPTLANPEALLLQSSDSPAGNTVSFELPSQTRTATVAEAATNYLVVTVPTNLQALASGTGTLYRVTVTTSQGTGNGVGCSVLKTGGNTFAIRPSAAFITQPPGTGQQTFVRGAECRRISWCR